MLHHVHAHTHTHSHPRPPTVSALFHSHGCQASRRSFTGKPPIFWLRAVSGGPLDGVGPNSVLTAILGREASPRSRGRSLHRYMCPASVGLGVAGGAPCPGHLLEVYTIVKDAFPLPDRDQQDWLLHTDPPLTPRKSKNIYWSPTTWRSKSYLVLPLTLEPRSLLTRG